jgi:hypothetical protein
VFYKLEPDEDCSVETWQARESGTVMYKLTCNNITGFVQSHSFILKYNFPFIFYFSNYIYYDIAQFINKHNFSGCIDCLFSISVNAHGRVPLFPLMTYNITFVQRGVTEHTAFEELTSHVGRVLNKQSQTAEKGGCSNLGGWTGF